MVVAITAEFPLGVYRGHGPSGSAEPLPEQPRLYSALVHAANTGSTATRSPDHPDRMTASARSLDALDWVEANPPEYLSVPEVLPVETIQRVAYRNEGDFEKTPGTKAIRPKVRAKPISDGFALCSAFGWGWENLPDDVAEALDDLCADVGYLGSADSPVLLRVVRDFAPTHHRVDAPSRTDVLSGEVLQTVAPGRRDILDTWHQTLHPSGKKAFKPKAHTLTSPPPPPASPREGIRNAVYSPIAADLPDAPWSRVLLIPVQIRAKKLTPVSRRKLMVTVHQTLTRLLGGTDPSGLITGRGNIAHGRANGLAFHLLDTEEIKLVSGNRQGPHLAIMIPRGVQDSELDLLLRTVEHLHRIGTRDAGALRIDRGKRTDSLIDGAVFWKTPGPGVERQWVTQAPAVAERKTKAMGDFTDVDVTLLWSLANVFKGMAHGLDTSGQPVERIRAVVQALLGTDPHTVPTLSTEHYTTHRPNELVHKTNGKMPVRAYTARIRTSELIGPRMAVSIGQSRHFGGGLLIPQDTPELRARRHDATDR